jgi:hypothetical protein
MGSLAIERDWQADDFQFAARQGPHHIHRLQLFGLRQFGDVVDRGAGHAGLADDPHPLLSRAGQQDRLHRIHHRLAVRGALAAIGQQRIVAPLGMPHRASQLDEKPIVAGGDADRAVGGLENLVWRQRGTRRAMPFRQRFGHVVSV